MDVVSYNLEGGETTYWVAAAIAGLFACSPLLSSFSFTLPLPPVDDPSLKARRCPSPSGSGPLVDTGSCISVAAPQRYPAREEEERGVSATLCCGVPGLGIRRSILTPFESKLGFLHLLIHGSV